MIPAGHHLVLVGMTGSGKSTVARLVAERLGRPLVDTDQVVETGAGRTIRSIFAEDGEQAFRSLETDALTNALADGVPAVIATGGGVVLAAANRIALRESSARVVWLCADPSTLLERVRPSIRSGHRPLLDDDPAGTLQRMCTEREPLYREVADAIVLVDHRSTADVVEAVLR